MSLDENVQLFVTECNELLGDMEQSLLALERIPNDVDLINQIFRAAHTIKGSAGLFGFDNVIDFTHIVENLLDDVRNCLLPVNDDLISLLMRAKDHTAVLINALPDEISAGHGDGQDLMGLLAAFKAGDCVASPSSVTGFDPDGVAGDTFHISLRLGIDTFRQGFDPAQLFGQLQDLGKIEQAHPVTEAIPPVSELDAEDCYLGWEIVLRSSADKQQIAGVFEFIDATHVYILAPQSDIESYQDLIRQLPEDDAALGQILVEIGTLTNDELQQVLNYQKECGGLTGDILVEKGAVRQEVVNSVVEKQHKIRSEKKRELSFVRVDSEKLDKLVTLVGELVISGAQVSQLVSDRDDDELTESMGEMTLTLEEIRETALGLRMVPIASTFSRFHRVIRDTAKELNKKIKLEVCGAETELDKTVIEKISDPLMHLIRNSIDHGIESPEVRLTAGKSEEGVITLNAFHEAGAIVIEVSDDGGGLNAEKLLSIAKQRGVVKAEQSLNEAEIYNLIFEPGFSTATSISNISGRGVGMDVVRRNIESLRGSVEVNSSRGQGVKMTIRLPLTLAIIDGFHVRVSDESFIIPLDSVEECVTLNGEQIAEMNVHGYIRLRGNVLPLLEMREHLGMHRAKNDSNRINLVVVKSAHQRTGLLVDELQGEAQAVIKPLGRTFQGVSGFSGFTILGSGQLALILDVPGLIKSAVGSKHIAQVQTDRIDSGGDLIKLSMH